MLPGQQEIDSAANPSGLPLNYMNQLSFNNVMSLSTLHSTNLQEQANILSQALLGQYGGQNLQHFLGSLDPAETQTIFKNLY